MSYEEDMTAWDWILGFAILAGSAIGRAIFALVAFFVVMAGCGAVLVFLDSLY